MGFRITAKKAKYMTEKNEIETIYLRIKEATLRNEYSTTRIHLSENAKNILKKDGFHISQHMDRGVFDKQLYWLISWE